MVDRLRADKAKASRLAEAVEQAIALTGGQLAILEGDDYAYSIKSNYDSAKWSQRLAYTEVREDFNPE